MGEIVAIPSPPSFFSGLNLHSNKLIFLLPLVFLIGNSSNGFARKNNDILSLGTDLIASINIESLNEKIDIIKKIGPYLPEPIIGSLNTIIISVEKISKIIGVMDFMVTNKSYTPILAFDNLTSKEKLNGILATVKDEVPENNNMNIKPIIDIVLNFDKYKGLINMMSSLNNVNNKTEKLSAPPEKAAIPTQTNDNKTNQIESMINALKPMLGNNENVNPEKIGDMLKMFEMLNTLKLPDSNKQNA